MSTERTRHFIRSACPTSSTAVQDPPCTYRASNLINPRSRLGCCCLLGYRSGLLACRKGSASRFVSTRHSSHRRHIMFRSGGLSPMLLLLGWNVYIAPDRGSRNEQHDATRHDPWYGAVQCTTRDRDVTNLVRRFALACRYETDLWSIAAPRALVEEAIFWASCLCSVPCMLYVVCIPPTLPTSLPIDQSTRSVPACLG